MTAPGGGADQPAGSGGGGPARVSGPSQGLPGPGGVRLRVDLAYDGGDFSGWARQPGQRTVQQTTEEALGRVLRLPSPPTLTVAGRTDAGVHARGQVAHCDIDAGRWERDGPAALRRLRGVLPPDVRVHGLAPAPAGFDARFSALWRRYRYRVCDDPQAADPLRRRDTLWHPRRLDLTAISEASSALVGEHDFAAFCRQRPGATTVRRLLRLEWARPSPAVAEATVVADAFCHRMVRALVGALVRVGEGAKPTSWPGEVLAGAVRDPAVSVLPPHGLCLDEVRYPGAAELSARARQTRQVRGAPGRPPGAPATRA